jgi:DNA-directed RNA polymerase specialized sigma24 family protein
VRPAIREVQAVDIDDLVQEAWPAVLRLIDLFASPKRPNATWADAVKRNAMRYLYRVEHKLVGVSERVWRIRRWLDRHPETVEPGTVVRRMALERQGQRRTFGTALSSSDKLGYLVRQSPHPLVSKRLVRLAQKIPQTVPLDVLREPEAS